MKRIFLFFCLLSGLAASAQTLVTEDDRVFSPVIKSVQLYPVGKESVLPVIALNSSEQLLLSFDEISNSSRTYNYTFQHCDAQWIPSKLTPLEYIAGFQDDRLRDYSYSSVTRKKYVHYELKFPDRSMMPKISGNYLLKVFEFDKDKPVLTRRFYVVNTRVSVAADIVASPNTALRETNQKVNFQLDYTGLPVSSAYNDIKVFIMQNARSPWGLMNLKPTMIRGTQLIYNDVNINDFAGGNEFRRFDTRTLRLNSERVERIYRDTANTVMLLTDRPRDKPNYTFLFDNNGKYFIGNQDGRDARTDGDYAHVYFNLAANKTDREGTAYVVGQFNNYQLNEQSKMSFDNLSNRFYTDISLKQGVYDYEYIWVDQSSKKVDRIMLEGTHFETENDYQLLVYFRPANARWDELVGYRLLNTGVKK
ncbi:type IX secretion system plug protein [Mucilaginibacter myungsuensis]|uniref:DUF5103 domain-containing protein n=1 Tax=Mucilaginibacter myungsuensis TaxID=649104 RepID=A0A929L104_9SPHI|nr:DUF5103 domain-containing protein [Mucilaginibacter myungsuensis]MBE9664247.1 DUF5103 domain-containing protein [Mucilaginibacter myungsuensis]